MRCSVVLMLVAVVFSMPAMALACPFCSAVSQTFTEEIESMDVVAIGRLIEAPPIPDAAADPDAPLPKAKFGVERILKGDKWVKQGDAIEILYFGEPDKTKQYLMMGTDPPQLMWSTPLGLTPRAHKYILALSSLAKDSSRLLFFQEHLEDEDEMLSRDAYDEFANAPYSDLINMRDKMHRNQLLTWIQDPDVPASRRRLYFTMLGVCGTEENAPLLKGMMQSKDRKDKAGLDALIACYLLLKGESGLDLVDDLFLKNPNAEYADTYAAIMAIRFHGKETEVIDKPRLVQSLRLMLERPELADLVIPDLARWNDWDAMPRLVQLFKDADEKSSWVRVPVINFLRACPLPEAKKRIEELSEIDPDAVKRAQTFFPFDPTGDGKKTGGGADANETTSAPSVEPDAVGVSSVAPTPPAVDAELSLVATSDPVARPTTDVATHKAADDVSVSSNSPIEDSAGQQPRQVAQAKTGPDATVARWQPNLIQLWGVPILAGFALLVIYRLVLGLPLARFHF